MLLPNASHAFVDPRKLAAYSLLPYHPVGGHKAVLFERFLGITALDAEPLGDILRHVASHAEAAIGKLDEFGQCYVIDFTLVSPTGSAAVRSAWIVLQAEDYPRLTTCYVLPR